jgi:hypothetical protein
MSLRRFVQRLGTIQFDAAECQMETRAGFEELRVTRAIGRAREGRDGACYDRNSMGECE